jgi:signal transduction histidine kinase
MPQPVSVAAFPAELRQVFTNLITNAAEAASPGGQVKVSIKPQTAGSEAPGQKMPAGATVTIADNGSGITAEVQPHLFQPFFTTKGEHGTGLGLWVSRGIINKHGGTISLKSDTVRWRASFWRRIQPSTPAAIRAPRDIDCARIRTDLNLCRVTPGLRTQSELPCFYPFVSVQSAVDV